MPLSRISDLVMFVPAPPGCGASLSGGSGLRTRAEQTRAVIGGHPNQLVPVTPCSVNLRRDGFAPDEGPRRGRGAVASQQPLLHGYIGGQAYGEAARFATVVAKVVALHLGCWNEEDFKLLAEQVKKTRVAVYLAHQA